MAAAKLPTPAFVPCTEARTIADTPPPVDGFEKTLDRRGDRALVLHHAGWAGHFLCEVGADGHARLLCKTAMTASARWLDDEHVIVSARDFTWVARIAGGSFGVIAGVEGVGGHITCLERGAIAVGDDTDGWRLLTFRDGLLRLEKGRVKVPDDAPAVDRELVCDGDRVFAATHAGDGALELVHWDRADGWDASAEWDKAAKKLAKGAAPVTVTAGAPRPSTRAPQGERLFADGSRWRIDGARVEVMVDGGYRTIALPEALSGPHLAELPDRERAHCVDALVHGALDERAGVAWLLTGAGKLVRASASTGEGEIVASLSRPDLYASEVTRGVFALADGRVVVAGAGQLVIVDPTGAAAPHVTQFGGEPAVEGCSAAVRVEGDLIAYARLCPSATKNGLPATALTLVEVRGWPVRWLGWEIPLYAPTLELVGTTLHASDGRRAIAFELGDALAWYRSEWTGRTDVPALPISSKKK
jgi:hypothetical protein